MGKHPKITVEEKSWDEIKADCREWAKEIQKDYQPDLIVFIAKSGFAFAQPMNEVFQCDMADIIAKRPGSGVKDKLRPIIERMPKRIVYSVISSPLSYRFHKKNDKRIIEVTERLQIQARKKHDKLLIVDDSVDSGWTLKRVRGVLNECFEKSDIRVAVYSVIDGNNELSMIDYHRHTNAVIVTATSRKSSEHSLFLETIREWEIIDDPTSITYM